MAGKPRKTNAQRAAMRTAEEYVTNKILAIFTLTFVIIMLLIMSYRGYSHMGSYLASYYGSWIAFGVAAAGTVVFGVWAWLVRAKRREKVFTPGHICFAFAVTALAAFASAFRQIDGVKLMYAVVPAIMVLLLVGMIYPRDFFCIAFVASCGVLLMYIYYRRISPLVIWERSGFSIRALAATVVAFVCLAVWTFALGKLKKSGGTVNFRGAEIAAYPKNASYVLSRLTAGVVALCTAAAYLFGSVAAYYAMFLLLAYIVAMAVVYTVKML